MHDGQPILNRNTFGSPPYHHQLTTFRSVTEGAAARPSRQQGNIFSFIPEGIPTNLQPRKWMGDLIQIVRSSKQKSEHCYLEPPSPSKTQAKVRHHWFIFNLLFYYLPPETFMYFFTYYLTWHRSREIGTAIINANNWIEQMLIFLFQNL